jgi:hypothetical protein
MPWYRTYQGETDHLVKLSLRDEVALKLEEALAGVAWAKKNEDFSGTDRFYVEKVEARLAERGYGLMLKVSDEDGLELEEELPLHVFLQLFQPVDEVNATDYNS